MARMDLLEAVGEGGLRGGQALFEVADDGPAAVAARAEEADPLRDGGGERRGGGGEGGDLGGAHGADAFFK